jgi:hypothetical protein
MSVIGWLLAMVQLTTLLPSVVKIAKCQLTRVKRCRSKPPSFHPGRPTFHGLMEILCITNGKRYGLNTIRVRDKFFFSDGMARFLLDIFCNVKRCSTPQVYSSNKIQITVCSQVYHRIKHAGSRNHTHQKCSTVS